jgi:hypothetical protein
MDLGHFRAGELVWVPALSHSGSGAEVNPTTCVGKYYKVGTVVSTPLAFVQFDSETGVYYATIDTSGLSVGVYMVLVEALVGGVNKNATHVFQVEASVSVGVGAGAATTGDCLSVADVKLLVDASAYTDTQIQNALDFAFAQITNALGHAFGKAFRVYHDTTDGATAVTITVDSTKVSIIITGGANAGTHDFTFATWPYIGDLLSAITDHDIGVIVELLEVIQDNQLSSNLKPIVATNILGFTNRITAQFRQWTECMDGNNEHNVMVHMPIRMIVSVTEDGYTLDATDYLIKHKYNVVRACATGSSCSCYVPGYWSCVSTCNVCVTYVPDWFGKCPGVFKQALLGFAQTILGSSSSGYLTREHIGDYEYTKGPMNSVLLPYLSMVLMYQLAYVI